MVSIRKATLDDLPELLRMGRKLIDYLVVLEKKRRKTNLMALDDKTAEKAWRKYYIENIKSKKSLFIVALKDDKIVGMGMARIGKSPPVFKRKEFGEIHEVFVKKAHRHQGIGSALVERLEEFFQEKGITLIQVMAENFNFEALEVYRKLGYQDSRFILHKEL